MYAGGAPFEHTDDTPALEFQAARSLLGGSPARPIFDSLIGLKRVVGDSLPHLVNWAPAPGAWQAAFAQALPATDAAALAAARAALELAPRDAEFEAGLGQVLFERRAYADARVLLDRALASRRDDPDLLLTSGLTYLGLRDTAKAKLLLGRVRAAGGDSVTASAVLAEIAANAGDYAAAASEALRAVEAVRPTLARPFPDALDGVFTTLANQAPSSVADPLFERAAAARPAWQLTYWAGAVLNSRVGGSACEKSLSLGAELARFGWTVKEIAAVVRRCAGAK
jgi:tetratricopeptide (TPR) repeat protein